MPLLEYRCASCEKTAEFLVLAGDRNLEPVCPRCGSSEMSPRPILFLPVVRK